ncbi:MAG: CHAT domain-containing protein [Bacteroidota bacterium]
MKNRYRGFFFVLLFICTSLKAQTTDITTQLDSFIKDINGYFHGIDIHLVGEKLLTAQSFLQENESKLSLEEAQFYQSKLQFLYFFYRNHLGFAYEAQKGFLTLYDSLAQKPSLSEKEVKFRQQLCATLGTNYSYQGNFEKAEKYFLELYDLQNQSAYSLTYLISVYIKYKEYEKALKYGKEAFETRKKRYAIDKRRLGLLLISILQLSEISTRLGKQEDALKYLDLAQDYQKKHNNYSLISFGNYYLSTKDYPIAIDYFRQALDTVRSQEQLQERSIHYVPSYLKLGNAYYESGDLIAALNNYQLALQSLCRAFTGQSIKDNPTIRQIDFDLDAFRILNKKIQALHHLNTLPENQKKYSATIQQTTELAFALMDRIRESYSSDADRQILQSNAYPIFDVAISQKIAEGKVTEAFELAEKSKAVVLGDRIKNNRTLILAGIDEQLLEKERQTRYTLVQYEAQMKRAEQANQTPDLLRLRKERSQTKEAHRLILSQIAKDSAYQKIELGDGPSTVSDIQKELHKQQKLIEYFDGEDYLYAFIIGQQSIEAVQIEWTPELIKSVKQFNHTINFSSKAKEYTTNAFFLYQQLIEPLFPKKDWPANLNIVPDGRIACLPFAALITQKVAEGKEKNFRSHPYLIRQCPIKYNFSASIMHLQKKSNDHWHKFSIAYAPTFKEVDKTNIDPVLYRQVDEQRGYLYPLDSNIAEASYIHQILQEGDLIISEAATKAHFLNHAEDTRFIHIASHAKVDNSNPNYSYVAFSNKGNVTEQEFKLDVSELYQMQLKADMVVLSACETGIGKIERGEGILSIARAFAYAGAKSIITSLWSINDASTKNLMGLFYEELKQGKRKDQALQQAMLHFIEEAPSGAAAHPKYWAAFVPVGNMEPIIDDSNPFWLWLLILALLSSGLFFLARRFRSRQQQ